jgi:translocation and assembly module TamB
VGGTSGAPDITGTVKVVRGTLSFAGHSFDLDTGLITFNGGGMMDPTVKSPPAARSRMSPCPSP